MPDEIVQKILLEGDTEILHKLSEIGEQGFETFKEFAEAAEHGSSKLELFATAVGVIGSAIVGLASTISSWVAEQTEAIQKTNVLAEAFGVTAEQAHGLTGAFASMGVSAETFEQFAQRIIITIARDWPQITAAVRTSATQQDEAQSRVTAAILRVQDAQRNLANVSAQEGSKIANANLRVEQTFVALQFAAARAASEQRRNLDGVRGAALSLEAAQQRLNELQGRPPSEAEKKSLEIAQAQLAVDTARQAQIDARLKQQQGAAEAASKQAAAEQAHADAQLKRETLLQEGLNARAKAELQVREAVNARAEAEEKAAQARLKDLPTINATLTAIKTGNKEAAREIDISKVKVEDLTKSLILAASSGIAGKAPDGYKVMSELSKVLAADTTQLIDKQQRLALVQQLGSQAMQTTNTSVLELLHALEKGPEFFDHFTSHASHAFATTEKGKHNVEEFQRAVTGLAFAIEGLNRDFAAAAAPVFTDFLKAMQGSLESSTGTLHLFVEGIKGIGNIVGFVIAKFQSLFAAIDSAFNLEKGRALQIVIAGLVIFVGAFASAWLGIPAVIATVVVAIGYIGSKLESIKHFYEEHQGLITGIAVTVGILIAAFAPWTALLTGIIVLTVYIYENWDKIKAAAASAWEYVKDTTVYKFLEGVIERAKEAWKWLEKMHIVGNAKGVGDGNASSSAPKYATGGEVHGPGTSTSDSIFARLSAGEFVVKADAVAAYGANFFHSLNSMQFPGFASGGMVSSAPARLSGGGAVAPTSVVNLTIDGQQFGGLKGPKNVVDSLASFAVGRQTASAGRTPSWNK